jgi:predicted ester cyclase
MLSLVKEMVAGLRNAFPDLRFEIADVVSCDDKVLVRWTAHGTHKGELGGAAPTGKRVSWTGMDLIRLDQGRIVELWGDNGARGLWEQLES